MKTLRAPGSRTSVTLDQARRDDVVAKPGLRYRGAAFATAIPSGILPRAPFFWVWCHASVTDWGQSLGQLQREAWAQLRRSSPADVAAVALRDRTERLPVGLLHALELWDLKRG